MLSNWLLINREFFEGLEPQQQHAIITAAKSQLSSSLASDLAASAGVIDRFVDAGATVHSALPPAILERLRAATVTIIEQKSAADSVAGDQLCERPVAIDEIGNADAFRGEAILLHLFSLQ